MTRSPRLPAPRCRAAVVGLVLLAGTVGAAPAAAAPERTPDPGALEVYVGDLAPDEVATLRAQGLDREDLAVGPARSGTVPVEAVLSRRQAAKLAAQGIDLAVKQVDGTSSSRAMAARADDGHEVYRSYSEPGGIRDELEAAARENPTIAELVTVGRSRQGKPILAVRVTKDPESVPHGSRPAVLYNGTQHAREWITTEMVRRLLHAALDTYGTDRRITRLVDTTELWFLPVANPDGYDYTFTEGNRLWRKNLRDNDGDGEITGVDGVDLNRNFPTRWGWDNEGSSPDPSDQTYRGPRPASEPETRAMMRLVDRVDFEFQVNYHSAAELLLYGTGWQVNTPTPDDVIYEALAGTDEQPAVPGYDPDISAELYTTNGETTEHVHQAYGTLAFTPEMSTCETVSAQDENDEWLPEDCPSIFSFPDDERLIQQEFERNVPFALSLAVSAHDPDDPWTWNGTRPVRSTTDFRIDPFAVSYGTEQPVAVVAKRALRDLTMVYRVNGGPLRRAAVEEWGGGERYGSQKDVYFAEFRGTVTGTAPGDRVEVAFTGVKPGTGRVVSERFTYRVHDDVGGDVLVLAAEDVTGTSPEQDGDAAKYADDYARALRRSGYTSDVYDVDTMGGVAPHHLGVLSHYRAVVWETGDDVMPRVEGQPAGTATELLNDLELTARDYLNEGGKLLVAGQYALFAQGADGVYYYNPFEEEQGPCTAREYPCLPMGNDFLQYWLGAYQYVSDSGTSDEGPLPLLGTGGAYGGFRARLNGGSSADNQTHTAAFLTTSSFLPPARFPQFASSAPIQWAREGAAPYEPYTGDWYLYSGRSDVSYKRLARTVDLTSADAAALTFKASYDTELDWDYLFVEARPVGTDDWTTLPDANGHTAQGTGDSCPEGWVAQLHPQLAHYMNEACEPTGTTGEWHAATGNSNGWTDWSVDLSRYAGQQVEVSISYVSDWGTQGLGVFLDDVAVTADGATVAQTSFETEDLDGFEVVGPPEGSAPAQDDWARSQEAFEDGAGVTTDDTVYVGFGVEGLRTRAQRTELIRRTMEHLLGGP